MFALTSCGYSSRNSDLIGQVKRVVSATPVFCDDRVDADISLGVMRNGIGSMSTQDVWVTVPNKDDQELLKKASETGAIVKATYDVKRTVFCWQHDIITHVELVK